LLIADAEVGKLMVAKAERGMLMAEAEAGKLMVAEANTKTNGKVDGGRAWIVDGSRRIR